MRGSRGRKEEKEERKTKKYITGIYQKHIRTKQNDQRWNKLSKQTIIFLHNISNPNHYNQN